MQMTVRACAKINWALDILKKREDGYHEMNMLMQNIDMYDEIHITPARFITLEINGHTMAGSSKNLIVRAAMALNEYVGENRGAKLSLKKRIPVRAGLGGGSADCAVTILALNEMWNLHLTPKTLLSIGEKLGADVPYCMQGGLCRVSGIGEILQPMPEARVYPLLIVHVGEGLSTQAVFSAFDDSGAHPLNVNVDEVYRHLSLNDPAAADKISGNALETPAIALMPEIEKTMRDMRDAGALYVRMSGSGSAVYGVFPSDEDARKAQKILPNAILTHTLPNSPTLFQ